jgi:curved DNA-binding protein
MNTTQEVRVFEDHYETLQLSSNADSETVDRVYRVLVRRYHPDNQETGDPEKFTQVVKAHKVLSDPEARAAYDVSYEENRASVLKIFDDASSPESYDGDKRIFEGILSLLYISRRRDSGRGGMGVVQLERLLGCPAKHLEFHLWYLREKTWVERLENGMLAITAAGVDRVMEQDSLFLRRDRLLSERAAASQRELADETASRKR